MTEGETRTPEVPDIPESPPIKPNFCSSNMIKPFLSIHCLNIFTFCTMFKPLERQVAVLGLSVPITVSS